jgi:hypothetical protein
MLQKARKSFKLKILTSNPYALKILQTIFAAPAPVKAFRGMGGGGVPLNSENFRVSEELKMRFDDPNSEFIRRHLSTG